MTDANARATADLVLVSAGIAAAYLVLSKPRLRRLAFGAIRYWLGASVPVFLLAQARNAWAASGSQQA